MQEAPVTSQIERFRPERDRSGEILIAVGDRDIEEVEERQAGVTQRGAAAALGPGVFSASAGISGDPREVLALQRQIGNASVGRLLRARAGTRARADGPRPTAVTTLPQSLESTLTTGERALQQAVTERAGSTAARLGGPTPTSPPDLLPAREQVVQRSFFGSLWSGVKHAASAVASGVKTAATAVAGAVSSAATTVAGAVSAAADWVWDGAKQAGSWAVDWLSKAGGGIIAAINWIGPKAWDIIKQIGTALWEKLSLLGELAWDFVSLLPTRVVRLVVEQWDSISSALTRLIAGIGQGISWKWIKQALIDAAFWAFDLLVQALEVTGIVDGLQLIWGMIFDTRELTEDEITASKEVHGEHLIPYGKTRVDQHSYLVRLGKWVNQLFGDKNASERAITTFHIIHAPEVLDIETAVHELTHVAQYEHVGAVYMPQALHGQSSEKGYDYGDLARARTDGKHYKDFNREQQAQIAEDYYLVKHGRAPYYGGSAADLQPFIDEMRAGAF
jgi:hypothetical protein